MIFILDIDECADGNNGGCEQDCNNEIGTYNCSCLIGYLLDEDEKGCSGMTDRSGIMYSK